MIKKYLVIFEKAKNNWAAYSPDVPGCVATGKTREETSRNFADAPKFHFEGLKEDGLPIPEPSTNFEQIAVEV